MADFLHDPAARLDYSFTWGEWLDDGETVYNSSWAVTPAGPTLSDSTFDATSTTVWVAGASRGVTYRLTNHVTTTEGRQDDRSHRLKCVDR